jgi:ATP-dependent protease HslVU (ClpYQ) peptidase subunit|tara:strand:- start:1961 stop:2386 length:426 start_codon:yes stop_codon:yes gene_type:complete
MNNQKIKQELEEIISSGLAKTPLPMIQNNSIRIGKIIITPKEDGFRVYNLSSKTSLGKTYSRNAALAIAKICAQGECLNSLVQEILDLDQYYQKYDTDCTFYNHTIKRTKDDFKKDIIETRYYDALERKYSAVDKINKFIL